MTRAETFNIEGEQLTLREISERYTISLSTLKARRSQGLTDMDLLRPLYDPGATQLHGEYRTRPVTKVEDDLREKADLKRLKEQTMRQISAKRTKRRDDAQRAMREAHAKAFSEPLISRNLLTPTERKRISERVLNSGQRSWAITGAAS